MINSLKPFLATHLNIETSFFSISNTHYHGHLKDFIVTGEQDHQVRGHTALIESPSSVARSHAKQLTKA